MSSGTWDHVWVTLRGDAGLLCKAGCVIPYGSQKHNLPIALPASLISTPSLPLSLPLSSPLSPLFLDRRRVRRAACRVVSALVLERGVPVDSGSFHEKLLLAAAQDEKRADVRAASLRAAADVLAERWRATPLNTAAGLPNNAVSLVAAVAVTEAGSHAGAEGEVPGAADAHGAVRQALAVLASPPSGAIADGIARRVVVAAERVTGFLEGRGAQEIESVRGIEAHAAAAMAAVRAASGLVALWSSSRELVPPPVPLLPVVARVLQSACIILNAAQRGGDPELARECRGLFARIATELPALPEGSAALGCAVHMAVERVAETGGEPPPPHEETVAVLKGHTLLMEAALASLRSADESAPHRRWVFTAAAHALTKQLEPPPSVVASTTRADPALDLVADPAAAASAPKRAAVAAARMRLLASIIDVLPPKERLPPRARRPRDALEPVQSFLSQSGEVHSTPPAASGRRAPLIIEIIDDDEAPSAPASRESHSKEEQEEQGREPSSSFSRDRVGELMSVGTAAALAAAGYARGAAINGAGGLPGWSSAEAAEAACALCTRCFSPQSGVGGESLASSRDGGAAAATMRAATGCGYEFDDAAREHLARCLGEAAPSLAHCLNPEPELRWGGEPDHRIGRREGPPAPELPPKLTQTLQTASVEGAVVAAVRLQWLLAAAGYPWVGRVGGGDPGGGVVSRVVPCVLRAMVGRGGHTSIPAPSIDESSWL